MESSNKRPLVGVLILGLIGAVIYLLATSNSSSSTSESPANPQSTSVAVEPAESSDQYISYETYQNSGDAYTDTNVVLFFNASWCSTCKKARDNFESSLDQLPPDLTIVVVDFDENVDLKKQYGVTVQHTFVQINDHGEELKKWSGSISVDDVNDQVI